MVLAHQKHDVAVEPSDVAGRATIANVDPPYLHARRASPFNGMSGLVAFPSEQDGMAGK